MLAAEAAAGNMNLGPEIPSLPSRKMSALGPGPSKLQLKDLEKYQRNRMPWRAAAGQSQTRKVAGGFVIRSHIVLCQITHTHTPAANIYIQRQALGHFPP